MLGPSIRSLFLSGRSMSTRVSITKPREPSFFRRKLLALSEPKYPPVKIECISGEEEYKRLVASREEANVLEALYGEQMKGFFYESAVIGFYHCNHITVEKRHVNWQNAKRLGMDLRDYNRRSCKSALLGTKWENCLHFVSSCRTNQYMTFSPDPNALPNLLKFEKKSPELLLIGAVAYDRILKKAEIVKLSESPPIEALHSEMLSILQTPQRQTLSYISRGAQELSQNLSQYVKDNQTES